MSRTPTPEDTLHKCITAYHENGERLGDAANALGIPRTTLQDRLKQAARRGLMGPGPTLPGFVIDKITEYPSGGCSVVQVPEPGPKYEPLPGFTLAQRSTLANGSGEIRAQWSIEKPEAKAQALAMRMVVDALKEEIPRAELVPQPLHIKRHDLINQYVLTDAHFGKLAWGEETGSDYDLKIAEELYLDWFSMALRQSPDAATGILAQLGDLLHYDAQISVTPTHAHVLDSDTRLQKMIRVVIRVMRRFASMMLNKYDHVHWIMADANHDPSGEAWLREMFAAFFEDEPRFTIDRSPSSYYAYEFGQTSLFYHHGHKRKPSQVDAVFAGRFREIYGRTKHSYAHLGHRHSDELLTTNLMKVEQHETLASPDAHEANGGWPLGRSAKVITYSKRFGEVGRSTITPEMIMKEALQ